MKMLVQIVLLCCLSCGSVFAAEPSASLNVPVNINTANANTLALSLNGVGEKKAQAIIDYRDSVGGFKSVDELTAVKGIGLAFVERNRERIVLE